MAHKTHIIDLYSLLGHELSAFGSDISQVDNVNQFVGMTLVMLTHLKKKRREVIIQ